MGYAKPSLVDILHAVFFERFVLLPVVPLFCGYSIEMRVLCICFKQRGQHCSVIRRLQGQHCCATDALHQLNAWTTWYLSLENNAMLTPLIGPPLIAASLRSVSSKSDQPRFIRVKLQFEFGKTASHFCQRNRVASPGTPSRCRPCSVQG